MVENDQAELQIWLEHYERDLGQMMSSQVGPGESLLGPDQERDKTYVVSHVNSTAFLTDYQI